jgi:hypothetical protein
MESYFHGVAPFGYMRVKACLAALRILSWPTPSFVASYVPRHPSRALSRLLYLSIINTVSVYLILRAPNGKPPGFPKKQTGCS